MAACARSAGRFLTISDVLTSSSAVASTALVVLNVPLHVPTVAQLWRACRTRVCADGASFRLADADLKAAPLRFIPDVIAGDMDSASSSLLDTYKSLGSTIVVDKDEDHHDLDKCLEWLRCFQEETNDVLRVFVYGGFGGRADHVLSNIATMSRWSCFEQLVVLSEHSACEMLQPGSTTITCSSPLEGPHCGLIPFGGKARAVTTHGLQWNLEGQDLSVSGLISSSNLLDGDAGATRRVHVSTRDPVLWTVELQPDKFNSDLRSKL